MGRKALLDGDSETVILSCCAPVQRVAGGCVAALDYRCEAAGWAFTRRYEAGEADEVSESSDADATPSGGAEDYGREKEKKAAAAGYLKISELLKGVQLYELMGISEGASQEEIKKAYRTLALSAHPDKQAAMEPEEAKKVEENFIKIQEAYELLSDPVKRKQYDSSLDFDDALPRLRKGDDFFKVFGEAFRRNARFSVKRPVPELGAKEDEPKVWKRFYDFWDNFQSWRDPVMLAQKAGEEICDLAEAECREERRWMVRENERVARKYKQQERERIAKLVSLAESSDPRVQAEKDAKRLAREAEQAKREEERNAARRAKEEAEKRQREEEEAKQRALEQKRKEEKAAREAVKERVKKCRQRLRGFHQAVREHVVLEQLNEVCVQLSEEELRALGDQLELALKGKAVEKAVRLLHEAIEAIGLVPMKVQVEEASTTSGPGSEEDNTQRRLSPEEEELERQRQAEKARLAAERAEEKKKKEEQRKKEQAAAEAAKRQQEKKEEQKAKKASEKQKKQEEQDKLRKEQQREESRLKAQEQSERDKQLAQQKKQEMELERAVQAFSQDRVSRLTRLETLSDEQLLAQLAEATEADATLGAALQLLKASGDVEKGMALVHHIGVAWGLGLQAPLRMENAVRNRVKKGRKRLTDSLAAFLKASETFEGTATAWQRGIVEGSIEVPAWEPAEEAEEAPKEAPKEKKKAKKEKNDEDLDQILAELDTPAKGSKKSKKK